MNRRYKAVPLWLVVFVVLLATACAGVSPQRVALNSLQGIRESVVASVKVFNTGYQAGQFNELQRTQLGTLYTKYLAADKIAAEALGATTVGGDTNALVSQVTIVAADVLRFVQSLKGAP
jgi:hypothetical protein